MPTVHPIDEEGLTEAGQDGAQMPPGPDKSNHCQLKEIIMNAKLLFAATVIVSAIASLASTAALADEGKAPLTRAQVVEQLNVARANGTLQRTDYDVGIRSVASVSTTSRANVVEEFELARASGTLQRTDYDSGARDTFNVSTTTRAAVVEQLKVAITNGTLQRTDYDDDQALVARRAAEHDNASPILARLFRGKAG